MDKGFAHNSDLDPDLGGGFYGKNVKNSQLDENFGLKIATYGTGTVFILKTSQTDVLASAEASSLPESSSKHELPFLPFFLGSSACLDPNL